MSKQLSNYTITSGGKVNNTSIDTMIEFDINKELGC